MPGILSRPAPGCTASHAGLVVVQPSCENQLVRRLFSLTAVALSAAVCAATASAKPPAKTATKSAPASPAAAAQACLAASGAKFGTVNEASRYPEEKQSLYWVVTPKFPISIYFTANDAAAERLEQRFTKLGLSFGYSNVQIASTQGRIGSVVWSTDVGYVPTSQQLALLKSCLAP
jgi:hypothetical protein